MTLTRRQAREWAIQMLTAAELNPPDPNGEPPTTVDQQIASFWNQVTDLEEEDGGPVAVNAKYKAFAEERVRGVLSAQAEIDEILKPLLEKWDLYRLGTVERVVLRLGIWEMKFTDVPKAVAINEAIDLANWFASPKSRTLVNGVLDRYAKSTK